MLIPILFFAVGSVFGSFINAVVWRLHKGTDFIHGRSECVHCGHRLSVRDLIPIISWLLLRARCRYCGKSISRRYPALEIVTGGVFAWSFLAWDFGPDFAFVHLVFWLLMAVGLIMLAEYDLRWMLLPDKVLLPLGGLALVQLITFSVLNLSGKALIDSIMAAMLAALFFYGLFAYSKGRWMGGGDVKLVFVMGLILGLANTLIALLVAFNVAALVSLTLIATRRMSRKDYIPFGPFLIGGTIVAMLHGIELFEAYSRIFLVS